MVQTASVQRARCCELPGLGNHCASSWRDTRRARCQLNDALWTRVRLGITLLRTRGTQHQPPPTECRDPYGHMRQAIMAGRQAAYGAVQSPQGGRNKGGKRVRNKAVGYGVIRPI